MGTPTAPLEQTQHLLTRAYVDGAAAIYVGDAEAGPERPVLSFDVARYRDMGEPAVITVTIRPGDHLNPA